MSNDKIVTLKIAEILVDPTWNARSGKWDQEVDAETGTGFETFKQCIEAEGQREPVIVRPLKSGKHPYALVAGFRRTAALKALGKDSIRAVVEELDEKEARYRNIFENTARKDLKGADLAWAVGELVKCGETDTFIANKIGRSQSYVGRLHQIIADLKSNLFQAWRAATVDITVNEVWTCSKMPKDRQDEEWAKILEARTPKKEDGKGKHGKIINNLKKRGEAFGRLLGLLARDGHIKNMNPKWNEVAITVLPIPKKAKPKQIESIGMAMQKGYEAGLAEERVEDEDEDDTEE